MVVTGGSYAGDVARHRWGDGEDRLVSVTPTAQGIAPPLTLSLALALSVRVVVDTVSSWHRYQWWMALVVVGPSALVTLGRIARWRRQKIHVTSERVVWEAGVIDHAIESVDLRDVVAVRAERRLHERMTGRGVVVLETVGGPWVLARVRHPLALARVIDGARARVRSVPWAYDAVIDPGVTTPWSDPPRSGWRSSPGTVGP